MGTIVQWATILSPIIAVLIACWMSKSSKEDTAKQIAALEESTTKQIESIKELTRIQIEITILQLRKEMWDARHMIIQTMKKEFDNTEDRFAMMGFPQSDALTKVQERQEKERNLSYERDYFDKQLKSLEVYIKHLEALKAEITENE